MVKTLEQPRAASSSETVPARVLEIERLVQDYLICLDHGFDRSRPGYTAAATIVDGRIITAAHNVGGGAGVIVTEHQSEALHVEFVLFEPDTAVSKTEFESQRNNLPLGVPQTHDLHLAIWRRHEGGGVFTMHRMWGENLGIVEHDGMRLWAFEQHGERPRFGDSGALILSIQRNSQPIEPTAVGVLRGTMGSGVCVFSPIPQYARDTVRS